MIEKLSVQNFKSWANLQDMEFGKVTALFGANSSGKTSLIQLLLMLKLTESSPDKPIMNLGGGDRDYIDLGGYEDIVHGHNADSNVAFSLTWVTADKIPPGVWQPIRATLQVIFDYAGKNIAVKQQAYKATLASLDWDNEGTDLKERGLVEYAREFGNNVVRLSDGQYALSDGPLSKQQAGKDYHAQVTAFHKTQITSAQEDNYTWIFETEGMLNSTSASFSRLLRSVYYLGPLRDDPRRFYQWTGERPLSVGERGQYAVPAMLADVIAGSSNGHQDHLVESADKWLQRLGLVEQLELRPVSDRARLYELIVRSRGYQHEANLKDVGFGVSQILPIVVLAHFASPGSLIILEQPEIHLHPQVQAELADLFLDVALKRNVQFLIESHSEHLLMRLQRRIAERKGEFANLTEKDVRLYFCKREAEASVLEPLQMDEYGRIRNWPKDFFGDPVTERAAMVEAMFERQMAQTQ